ncbi:MAG: DUF882 domain-containing protein [Alphaproteobacteria bacterium]|nr:DUF882 domain-containing protein [Alphaproteobacteria bacterium]MBV9966729.1 DUF882 domain-containing protein [Alphaproteobacteria bacterium]
MIDRRTLLLGAGAGLASAATPALAAEGSAATCVWPPPNWQKGGFPSRRWAKILFVHTNERFSNIYMEDGKYIVPAVQEFSHTCRDFRANETKMLDPRLLDLLFVLHWKYCKDEIRIFSGFRSAATNAHIEGAAKNSQHIQGRALDIHLPNMDNVAVALDFRTFVFGGVGMYPGKQFTHMDMGNLRRWVG